MMVDAGIAAGADAQRGSVLQPFEQYATLVVATAESFRAALGGGPTLHQHLQAVVDRENEADAITREVILAVRRTVITPFGAIVTSFGIARW
jgi:uncharacterized protein